LGGLVGAALFHVGRWAYSRRRSRSGAVAFAEQLPGSVIEELGVIGDRDRRFRVSNASKFPGGHTA
ncbi:MAG TPA: hypothetical protein VGK73_38750, partial [Polyangiaceae bacterium]